HPGMSCWSGPVGGSRPTGRLRTGRPLVVSLSSAMAARAGVLIKDRLALERMRLVEVVLFDKTGTLTKGQHAVTGLATVEGIEEEDVLRLAGAVEADSEHPLA